MMSTLVYPLFTFVLVVVCVSYWGITALYLATSGIPVYRVVSLNNTIMPGCNLINGTQNCRPQVKQQGSWFRRCLELHVGLSVLVNPLKPLCPHILPFLSSPIRRSTPQYTQTAPRRDASSTTTTRKAFSRGTWSAPSSSTSFPSCGVSTLSLPWDRAPWLGCFHPTTGPLPNPPTSLPSP